jgi:hypothetical protein
LAQAREQVEAISREYTLAAVSFQVKEEEVREQEPEKRK